MPETKMPPPSFDGGGGFGLKGVGWGYFLTGDGGRVTFWHCAISNFFSFPPSRPIRLGGQIVSRRTATSLLRNRDSDILAFSQKKEQEEGYYFFL